MPENLKERIQERFVQIKGEGTYKGGNPIEAYREQSLDPEELPSIQLGGKNSLTVLTVLLSNYTE